MTPDQLVGILLSIVEAQPLTEAQRYEVMGRFNSGILGGTRPPVSPAVSSGLSPDFPKTVIKENVEAPLVPGNVIIPKGHLCTCALCKKVAYITSRDITEVMKIPAFIASFTPQEGSGPMTTATDIWADPYGNLAVDCPICKGRKTVWIKGKSEKLFSDYPETDAMPLSDR